MNLPKCHGKFDWDFWTIFRLPKSVVSAGNKYHCTHTYTFLYIFKIFEVSHSRYVIIYNDLGVLGNADFESNHQLGIWKSFQPSPCRQYKFQVRATDAQYMKIHEYIISHTQTRKRCVRHLRIYICSLYVWGFSTDNNKLL